MTAPALPTRRRKRVDGMTVLMILALIVTALTGLVAGAALADSARHDCNAHGGVWIAGAAHSRCVPADSFTGLMLGLTG